MDDTVDVFVVVEAVVVKEDGFVVIGLAVGSVEEEEELVAELCTALRRGFDIVSRRKADVDEDDNFKEEEKREIGVEEGRPDCGLRCVVYAGDRDRNEDGYDVRVALVLDLILVFLAVAAGADTENEDSDDEEEEEEEAGVTMRRVDEVSNEDVEEEE